MYGLCFGAWPRPKATPRPNPQPPHILTPKGESRVHKGEGEALGVVFGQGIVYVFCFFNSVSPGCQTSGRFSTGVLDLVAVSEVTQQTKCPQDPAAIQGSLKLIHLGNIYTV